MTLGQRLSLGLSYVLHPIWMPSFGALVLTNFTPELLGLPVDKLWLLLVFIFLGTVPIPIFVLLMLYQQKVISSLEIPNREERFPMLWLMCLIYGVFTYMFYEHIQLGAILFRAMLGMSLSTVLLTLLTYRWKVSAHSAGCAGVFALVFALQWKYPLFDLKYLLISLLLLLALCMSARIHLRSHTLLEVLAGFLIGFICTFICVLD